MNTKTEMGKKRRLAPHARRLLLLVAAVALAAGAFFGVRAIERAAKRAEYVPLSAEEIDYAFLRGAEVETDAQRLAVAEDAVSLVGKVRYFWGGKSSAVGEDPAWGEIREVTGAGSESTGTMKPYGLDCSGFVAWCFIQQGLSAAEVEEQIGLGTWTQWDRTTGIAWKDLRVGDFVFQNAYPTNQGNHIGICIGFCEDGAPVFAHCAAGFDNVVVTRAGDVFRYARRPNYYEEQGETE